MVSLLQPRALTFERPSTGQMGASLKGWSKAGRKMIEVQHFTTIEVVEKLLNVNTPDSSNQFFLKLTTSDVVDV